MAKSTKSVADAKADLTTAQAVLADAGNSLATAEELAGAEGAGKEAKSRASDAKKAFEDAEKAVASAEAEVKAAVKAETPTHVIADGKAVTCGTRVLGPGTGVGENTFPEGKKTFDALVKSGHIVKNGE